MSEYLYGKILKIKKTNHVYAQLSSLNKKDRDKVYVVCLGENPDGIKENDRVRVDGTTNNGVMYASAVKVYVDNPERKSNTTSNNSKDDYTFRATVGNAVNVAFKWKGSDTDIDVIKESSKLVYESALKTKELLLSKYPTRQQTDIGMKLGSALNHVAETIDESTELSTIMEKAIKFVELQIEIEETLK